MKSLSRIVLSILAAWILASAAREVFDVAWGTGNQLGEFALTWALLFLLFALSCLGLFLLALTVLWRPRALDAVAARLIRLRGRLGAARWILVAVILVLPIAWLQFTTWGVVFAGIGFRLFLLTLMILACAFLLTFSSGALLTWNSFLVAGLLCASVVTVAVPLTSVTSYPFSLGWSEGNRLWDYSMLFGRDLYTLSNGQSGRAYLDLGRALIGGLPFLLPHVTIFQERLWVALIAILPYLFFGWSAFYLPNSKVSPVVQLADGSTTAAKPDQKVSPAVVLLAGLWTMIFLRQGPIHAPLLLSAMLVALAWRRPLWISLPAIVLASWFASVSRFTWAFAPAMWMGMLVLAGADDKPAARDWAKAIALGLAGALSGFFLPQLFLKLNAGVVSKTTNILSNQPLLWYRLLPNSTYSLGILLSLLLAILPLVIVLIYRARSNSWQLTLWQGLAILAPLLAFLVVGLIASTKIGGGADLHNMDMFLIGLVFAASLAWEKSSQRWIAEGDASASTRVVLLALVLLPALITLVNMQPLVSVGNLDALKVLTGLEDDPRNDPRMFGLLPSAPATAEALDEVKREVAAASQDGEVLFLDHRQLLTFGFVTDVPLVVDYEKKFLMDRAMGGTASVFFEDFYRDLAAHRFSMIVSDVLRHPIKDSEFSFGEENNAWVTWVVNPVLCYYEPKVTLEEFRVQLLVPRRIPVECKLP